MVERQPVSFIEWRRPAEGDELNRDKTRGMGSLQPQEVAEHVPWFCHLSFLHRAGGQTA